MEILNPAPELSLDFKPTFIPKTISQFLGEVARIGSVCEKILKVDDFVSRLETEIRKIDAFKRELPLCMLLMNDAIVTLKEELTLFKNSANPPTLEEFIPINKTCDEDPKPETDNGDKKNWLSSTLLWNTNDNNPDTKQNNIPKQNPVQQVIQKRVDEEQDGITETPYNGNSRREFIPFKGYITRNEDKEELPIPGLSLITPGIKNPMRGNGFVTKTNAIQSNVKIGTPQPQPPQQQTSRKQRRCWSTELHRRFLNALQLLGGSKVATPKQIRELMRVDGLTNDEVKSHLQKYRLHTRRLPSSNSSAVPLWTQDQYLESSKYKDCHQSGSPDGPLNCTTAGTSTTGGTSATTGGDSMDDVEDEKSENNCWKSHLHISGKDSV
ncbi:transcription factor HHO5 [Lactuca sativa]|uniref:HTH myb-type domain-containing protein n=1 Tax=Lactuca sativa TaxID=4236 RepID=A0A9R1UG93_LACSA|nr:transcription factor HHO5 [Lactuca sativa]KAJ0186757.1 hypothetical protein LSAT_V11C900500090 [Lactuca sativa]